jgi:hypothetical protein
MKTFVLILLILGFDPAHGESWTEVAIAGGGPNSEAIHSASLSWSWLRPLGHAPRFKIGAGARYTYVRKTGPITLGESRAWSASDVSIGSANIMVLVEANISKNISAGMNLDVLGLSHGRSTTLRSNAATDSASVRHANIFLVGKNDRGTLNSEFFLTYRFSSGQQVSAGLSHQVIEYEASASSEKLQRFYNLGFIRFGF